MFIDKEFTIILSFSCYSRLKTHSSPLENGLAHSIKWSRQSASRQLLAGGSRKRPMYRPAQRTPSTRQSLQQKCYQFGFF